MRLTLGTLRRLIRETTYYGLHIDQVRSRWPDELDDAVEFVMCNMRVDHDTAIGHVMNNWVFDTLDHDGQTYLLARDEATGDSVAYKDNMGGWYYRLGDNNSKCRQTGSQRGIEQQKSDIRSKKTVRPPARTGTMASGG